MCLGTSPISQLIADLEQGSYSHATYCTGNGTFIHVTMEGVKEQEVAALLDSAIYRRVGAYRPKVFENGPPGPVTAAARGLIGKPYDHTSLWMVALIVGLNSPLRNLEGLVRALPVLRAFAERYYGPADGAIARLTAAVKESVRNFREGDQSRLTCTEVVTTAFWNADTDRRYALEFAASAFWVKRVAGIFTVKSTGVDARLPPRKPLVLPEQIDEEFRGLVEYSVETVEDLLAATSIADDDVPRIKSALAPVLETADLAFVDRILDRRRGGAMPPDALGPSEDILRRLETSFQPKPVRAGTGFWDLPLNMVSPHDMEVSPSLRSKGWLVR